jgi:beta-glucosidase
MRRADPEICWDWDQIDPSCVQFPPDFLWGVATAAHQVEGGCDNNNWSRWERSAAPDGRPRIRGGQRCGAACEHWQRFREDIALMRELGVGAYRFSAEWSKIEPRPGRFEEAALGHYHEVCDALLEAGLQPVLTIHHFTDPLWFEELGGFEKSENLPRLVDFGVRLFREYGDKVALWCTINEPEVYATLGYGAGVFPPGKKDPLATAVVLKNLAAAHTELYAALKAEAGGSRARVGLVKNVCQFDPWRSWNPLDRLVSRILNRVYNGSLLDYLRTGRFHLRTPGLRSVVHEDPRGARSLDFLGLNYYSHIPVQFRLHPTEFFWLRSRPEEVRTDMPYTIYAEGLYRALQMVRELQVPIYVTENGIADARDDRRETYIERYLYALHRARSEGCDVRGYFYWSLMDNFEWAEGYEMRFGLYEMDFGTQARRLRKGAQAFIRRVKGKP